MPVEMRMWRIDGATPRPLSPAALPTENELHQFLRIDPSLLGIPLLVIGSEVLTPYGKRLDVPGHEVGSGSGLVKGENLRA
ncbi:hypothetical protein GCM10009862_10930 [Microbacterium binotii]|uniref:Uncharacterized protein n=1 Tax=Microbacterium binotii TaxID=462710 RepID=A0ABN3P8G5_9MICO